MTIPQTVCFQYCLLSSGFPIFIYFFKQLEVEASGKWVEKNRRVQSRKRQTSPTTSYEGSSRARRDERMARRAIRREFANKCQRKERMLRAKRASSPERRGKPGTAARNEQRSSIDWEFEHFFRDLCVDKNVLGLKSNPDIRRKHAIQSPQQWRKFVYGNINIV